VDRRQIVVVATGLALVAGGLFGSIGPELRGCGRAPGEAPLRPRSGADTTPAVAAGSKNARRSPPERRSDIGFDPAVEATPSGIVSARVIDILDEAPISGARVALSTIEGETREALAGEDGRVRFGEVPPGSARLEVGVPDHASVVGSKHRTVSVSPGVPTTTVFRGVRARRVKVVVVDIFGEVVPNVRIEVDRAGVDPRTTNRRGRAVFRARRGDVVRARETEVAVTTAHLRKAQVRLRIQPTEDEIGTGQNSEGFARIRGRVVRASTREPVDGARVSARRSERDTPSTTRSSSDGTFELRLQPDARFSYRFEARHDTYGVAVNTIAVPTATVTSVVLALEDAGTVEGRVVRSDGAPATVFRVRHGLEKSGTSIRWIGSETFADPNGSFVIADVAPGDYTLEASTEREAPARVRGVRVPPSGIARVTIVLEEPGAVRGVVRDDATGEGIAGASVRLEGFGGNGVARTDASGAFHLDGLAPGRRSLVARAEGYRDRIVSAVDVQPEETAGPIDVPLTPRESEEDPELDLVGIGAVLETSERSGLEVRRVVAGGGAAESGLARGDLIVEVDGQSVRELGFDATVQALRGREGTAVRVRFERQGRADTVTIVRRAFST